jgi:hypothetical protein
MQHEVIDAVPRPAIERLPTNRAGIRPRHGGAAWLPHA